MREICSTNPTHRLSIQRFHSYLFTVLGKWIILLPVLYTHIIVQIEVGDSFLFHNIMKYMTIAGNLFTHIKNIKKFTLCYIKTLLALTVIVQILSLKIMYIMKRTYIEREMFFLYKVFHLL